MFPGQLAGNLLPAPFFCMADESVIGHRVSNAVIRAEKVGYAHRQRGLTRDTRATVEGVLDPRSLNILAKFKSRGIYTDFGGCISTGKEANVYAVRGSVGEEKKERVLWALKIFKTSILVFKNRHQYVEGEHRFLTGYHSASNPRKMVRQWAEKEFRNLRRLCARGVRAPQPLQIRDHIFAMSFLGRDEDTPAPRLKDLSRLLAGSTWVRVYVEVVALMRHMFHECKLVHGDLSEFNLLYFDNHPYVIDVSQSMENSHVHFDRYLKRDCVNVTNFFAPRVASSGPVAVAASGEPAAEDCSEWEPPNRKRREHQVVFSTEPTDNSLLNELTAQICELSDWSLSVEDLFDVVTEAPAAWEAKFANDELIAWPRLDSESRRQQWAQYAKGLRKAKEDLGSATADLAALETMAAKFDLTCAQVFRHLQSVVGSAPVPEKSCTDTAVFLQLTEPQSLLELVHPRDYEALQTSLLSGQETRFDRYLKKVDSPQVLDGEIDSSSTASRKAYSDTASVVNASDCGVPKFTGVIPAGVDRKEWRASVKEAQRLKRQAKMSKIKKKKLLKRSKRH